MRSLLTAARTPAADESEYTPLAPVRVLDTRNGTGTGGATAPDGPARTISLNLAARLLVSAP